MSLKSILLVTVAITVPTFLAAQPRPLQVTPPNIPIVEGDDGAEVVVVRAQRAVNSVQGDAVPETTLSPLDIRALGASNVTEILSSLGARAGSGRGRGEGQPVVLLNGRRVSGFGEVANLPSEAILRVEVFPEATALLYGFAADQRVVNFILRPRFRALTLEASLGLSANGDRSEDNPEINFLRITDKDRLAANIEITKSNAVTEAQRDIIRTTGLADSAFRTVLPQSLATIGNVTYARGVGATMGATINARIESTETESLLGLRALGSGDPALKRTNQTINSRLSASLDGATKGWQWTATAALAVNDTDTKTEIANGPLQTASSQNQVIELVANTSGALFKLPAGMVRGSIRTGYFDRQLDSVSVRNGLTTLGALSRGDATTRVTLSVPVTSRRGDFGAAFGDLSLSANASFTDLTDFSALQSTGFGVTWAPISDLRLSANVDNTESPPSIQQLGNPTISTPNSTVFDYVTGQTVLVTRTSGGNSSLRQESRDDVTLGINYAPTKYEGLDITFSWARNNSDNPVGSLSGLTPDLEAAFGERFTRVNGRLIAIDQRAINFAASQNQIVRYGFSYGRSFGQPIGRPPGASGASGGERPAGGRPPGGQQGGGGGIGGGMGGGGFGGMRGGNFGGMGGPPGGPSGRWNISIFHTLRLEDSVILRAGGPALDLLNGASIDDNGGPRRHLVEIEGGWSYRGLGFRATSTWRSGTQIDNGVRDLVFDDIVNVNLRAFISFDARREMIAKAPWLRRSRLILRVDNLTDAVQGVKDGTGSTPEAFQRGYLAPRGRFIELALRKQF